MFVRYLYHVISPVPTRSREDGTYIYGLCYPDYDKYLKDAEVSRESLRTNLSQSEIFARFKTEFRSVSSCFILSGVSGVHDVLNCTE